MLQLTKHKKNEKKIIIMHYFNFVFNQQDLTRCHMLVFIIVLHQKKKDKGHLTASFHFILLT